MAGNARRTPNEIARGAAPAKAKDADRQKSRNETERSKKSAALDTTASPGIDRADKKRK